ncbi:MAG: PIG-L deacetylase family protein [Rhodopila sp.]
MITAADWHDAWRALPVAELDAVIGSGTCLVLAPHPDDESVGCGGLIAACCAAERAPMVAILTDGAASHPGSRTYPPERMRMVRKREAHQAVAHLGLPAKRLVFCNYPDTQAPKSGPGFEAAVRMLCGLVAHEPDCTAIVGPWQHDPHADHEAAALIATEVAARSALRRVSYPVWGWLLPREAVIPEDAPARGCRLDITPFLPAKRRAVGAHKSQFGEVVTDDPAGFQIPPELMDIADQPFETFLLI